MADECVHPYAELDMIYLPMLEESNPYLDRSRSDFICRSCGHHITHFYTKIKVSIEDLPKNE